MIYDARINAIKSILRFRPHRPSTVVTVRCISVLSARTISGHCSRWLIPDHDRLADSSQPNEWASFGDRLR